MTNKSKAIFLGVLSAFYLAWFSNHLVSSGEVFSSGWPASVTMIFGSFVAGSTPIGGGAVSFPIFSKLLGASGAESRMFGFFIQSVGMSFATLFFILAKIRIDWRVIGCAIPFSMIGIIAGTLWLPSSDTMIKLSFSLFALSSGVLLLKLNSREKKTSLKPRIGPLSLTAFAGGLLSSQVGAGADTLLYFYLTLVCHHDAKSTIPTSVAFMAINAIGGSLISLMLTPENVTTFVLTSWLAAAPIVAIGAPVGGLVMSKIKRKRLIYFIKMILLAEALSTLMFVEMPPWLAGLLLAAIVLSAYYFVRRLRRNDIK